VTIDLLIAGRRIRLCSGEGVIIRPDERFSAFKVPVVLTEPEPDLCVEVDPGPGEIPASAAKVFDARLMEEVPGGVRNTGEPFWEIFSGEAVTYARVFMKEPERTALLVMPHGERRWRIFTGEHLNGDGNDFRGEVRPEQLPASGTAADKVADASSWINVSADNAAGAPTRMQAASDNATDTPTRMQAASDITGITLNPLPWPLDGLLLYFLFSQAGDIMIHSSGVITGGRGWLFTGRSGSGKTTMARIFDRAGDRVIHDDRLVLRHEGGRWVMHNTPVYRNDEPRSALLEHLWLIRHGAVNMSEPVAGAEAVAMILANCIQQNWDGEAASRLAAAVDGLATSVKVSRLSFVPDGTVRDYLLLRATAEKELLSGAVLSLLDEGRSVTVTAGGYSMWPAIRPGDAVVIGPCGDSVAAAGQVVALRRDGGFVLHRVTRVMTASGRRLIITCGDAAVRADDPAGPEAVAGVVQYIIRSGRQFPPPRRRWPRRINRLAAAVAGWVQG
jgi:hypothetical protein